MKRVLAALAAATIATPLLAQGSGGVILGAPQFDANGYSNRGQCVAALAHERNLQRKDPARRGANYRDLTADAFQRESLRTTRCELVNGRYQVVFYVNGFAG